MTWTAEEKQIYQALDMMLKACGFSGETGTEGLFVVIDRAVRSVVEQWGEVVQSHEDGLAYDVNAMLAREIAKAASQFHIAPEASEEHPIN